MKRQRYKRFKKRKDLIQAATRNAVRRNKVNAEKRKAAFEMYQITEDLIRGVEI